MYTARSRTIGWGLAVGLGGVTWPGAAWAMGSGDQAVSVMTAAAVALVVAVAGVMRGGLWLARRVRAIRADQELTWRRQLRVLFGGLVLLAALSPYVAVYMSEMAAALVVVALGGWVVSWWWWRGDGGEMIDPGVGRA